MSKIIILMDFISGLLLAYDFYPKSGVLLKFHNWIRDELVKTDTNDIFNKRTLVFNILISTFIFLMILAWAWYKESGQEARGIWAEIGLFLLGSIIAWIIITLLAGLFKKLGQESLTLIAGIIIAMVAFAYIPKLLSSVNVIVSLIAFVYMCVLYPFAMIIANNVRKALLADKDKPFYIFAMLGLALFVVSNLMELIV